MYYTYHPKSPWLKKVLVPFWAFQLIFMLALVSASIWIRTYSGFQTTGIVILIICAICSVLSLTEMILFAATRLHPLAYLILQLVKTTTWFVLFVLAAVGTMRAEGQQGSGLIILAGFVETLVLFTTFLGALIYAGTTYHRHRVAKSHVLGSLHSADLYPVTADEAAAPIKGDRTPQVPRNSVREIDHGAETEVEMEMKEAVEVTVLRELGGDWEVYELPATRSVRSSRGGRSVKGGR